MVATKCALAARRAGFFLVLSPVAAIRQPEDCVDLMAARPRFPGALRRSESDRQEKGRLTATFRGLRPRKIGIRRARSLGSSMSARVRDATANERSYSHIFPRPRRGTASAAAALSPPLAAPPRSGAAPQPDHAVTGTCQSPPRPGHRRGPVTARAAANSHRGCGPVDITSCRRAAGAAARPSQGLSERYSKRREAREDRARSPADARRSAAPPGSCSRC